MYINGLFYILMFLEANTNMAFLYQRDIPYFKIGNLLFLTNVFIIIV